MDLTECHRMAKHKDPMCGLYVIRKGHGHKAIYSLVKVRDGPQIISLQVFASPTETTIELH